jgi:tetratricopeptide (TPR) repeat protein
LLIAATFLVYWPALRNGFVWDDTALVLRDPLIRSWRLIPEGFRHFLFLDATASDFYRPLQRLSFTADYALFGFDAPWGWHLTSIAVHAAAAVALFFLAWKVSDRRSGLAFLVALAWTVHPLHTSAVTYVAGRADPLAALFGFTALALALYSLDAKRPLLPTLAAGACFLAALLSKESGVFALLVWFVVLAWHRVPRGVWGKWLLVAALTLGVYSSLRWTADRIPPPAPPPTPIAVRPILAARAVAEYAGLILAPRTLRMERDVTTFPQSTPEATIRNARLREYQTLLGALLILGLAGWLRGVWREPSPAALCLLAAITAYLPISNFFSLNATVAEHWLYIPSAFLFLAAAHSVRWKPIALAIVGAWIVTLGIRTWQRQPDWRDQRTFLTRTIATGGDTARMHINLGNLESSAGHHDAALAEFRAAIARAPEQPMAWFGLANAAIRARDFTTAHSALEKAASSPLLAADVIQSRAVLEHIETGRDTGDLLRQAVAAAPRNWGIRRRHLEHLDETGHTAEAARELRDFLAEEPFRAESWQLLGAFLERLASPASALAAYRQAAEFDVRDLASRGRVVELQAHP